ncbi:MAG: prepilin-type N-terminal cleavage/methylation domain-containing protein [Nitrospirota bacterium]
MIIKKEEGFTFIEILISMLIIFFVIAAIISLSRLTMIGNVYSRQASQSIAYIQDKMEELKNEAGTKEGYGNLSDNEDFVFVGKVQAKRQWDIIPNPPSVPYCKKVTVTISWPINSGTPHTKTMTTYMARP